MMALLLSILVFRLNIIFYMVVIPTAHQEIGTTSTVDTQFGHELLVILKTYYEFQSCSNVSFAFNSPFLLNLTKRE